MGHDDERTDLFDELLERSAVVADLEPAQIEGFVSGLFAAWDDEDDAIAFVERCRDRPGAVTAVLCAAVAELGEGRLADDARRAFDSMAGRAPHVATELGRSQPLRAWSVRAPFGRSIVIGCGAEGEAVDHAVLIELDDEDLLVDLRLSAAPTDLDEPASVGDDSLDVDELDLHTALETARAAWRRAVGRIEPTPGLLANQRVARRRLGVAGDELPVFANEDVAPDLSRGMSSAEIAEANAAARSTLLAALGDPPGVTHEIAWVEVVRGSVAGLSPRERDALLWLEWADWLGAGIGLLRGRHDGPVDGHALVDLVNACPEVSSTIHGDDREYAAWAFDVALEHLADAGLVVDGALSDRGRSSLHRSLVIAWDGE